MSTRRVTVPRLLMLALALVFVFRAGVGWVAGMADSQGRRLSAAGRYESAIPLLDRGAIGQNRVATLWLAGEARLGLYQVELDQDAPAERLDPLLAETFQVETDAISRSPASGWTWASLADVYHQQERERIHSRGLSLGMVEENRWAFVNRPGRIAIGLLRTAIEREPTQYLFYDQLAFVLFDYGLMDEAIEVVRQSATVQPDFGQHEYTRLPTIPAFVLDAFVESSRESLGNAPLIQQFNHLLALGKLELRRGKSVEAERDLRAALERPGTEINYSEARFLLGIALKNQGRHDEAVALFIEAAEEPVFRPASLAARAAIAEQAGDLEQALSLMRQARRLEPRQLDYGLSYARMAVRFEKPEWAEEALRWSIQVHPRDPRPLRQLERLLLDEEKTHEAGEVRRKLDRIEAPPESDDPGDS